MKLTELYKSVKRTGYIKKYNEAYEKWKNFVDSNHTKYPIDHPDEKRRLSYYDNKSDQKVEPYDLPQHKDVEKYYKLLLNDLIKELDDIKDVSVFEDIKNSFRPMTYTADKTLMFRAILIAEDKFKKQ
tara:strand:+ start:657 stop:1040 length:384 start_codon:yes stop_codon:yes gene_type:complete